MKILLLGGTGAMGTALAGILSDDGHEVHITSRKQHNDHDNIQYLLGNAKDDHFLFPILTETAYDAVVDFMIYSTASFERRVNHMLRFCRHYLFLSSSRVYASSDKPITENSPRLLDICKDEDYLRTDEYALAKARQENLLFTSGKTNWTIIRPYITYNTERLQLGIFEKEQWLFRALRGKSIVFSRDIADRTSVMTYGGDVAYGISRVICNPKAYARAIHFVSPYAMKWSDMLEIYQNTIEQLTGKRPKVSYLDSSHAILPFLNPYQLKYDRLYDRIFDNSAAADIIGEAMHYRTFEDGIRQALTEFLEIRQDYPYSDLYFEATLDRFAGDLMPIFTIPGIKRKLQYLYWRFLKKV